MMQSVPCFEICDGDKLVGYAIHFSGRTDAYVAHTLPMVRDLAFFGSFKDTEEAIAAVKAEWNQRRPRP